jgi:hypothetical protein
MTRIRHVISAVALFAFLIGAIAAVTAGNWEALIMAVLGGAVVALWPRPAR